MDIVAQTEDSSPLKFKVGGATLVFEKAEDWKYHLRNLLVQACQAVAEQRVKNRYRSGDILYSSLVHSIVQMIETFMQQKKAVSTSQVNLQQAMSFAGIWKDDAQLDIIVEVASRFLVLYKDVDPSRADLKTKLLFEFEVVWREVIDPFLSTHLLTSRDFREGGTLFPELLGPETCTMLKSIRTNVIRARQRGSDTVSSSGATLPTDE